MCKKTTSTDESTVSSLVFPVHLTTSSICTVLQVDLCWNYELAVSSHCAAPPGTAGRITEIPCIYLFFSFPVTFFTFVNLFHDCCCPAWSLFPSVQSTLMSSEIIIIIKKKGVKTAGAAGKSAEFNPDLRSVSLSGQWRVNGGQPCTP